MRLLSRLALLAGAFLAPVAANAQTQIYSNNFESGLGSNWGTAAFLTNSTNFTNFVGRFSNGDGTILMLPVPTINDLESGQYPLYTVTFDLYTIDSWDGNSTTNGPDSFNIWVNSLLTFQQTFSTHNTSQSFRAPDVGPVNLGFNASMDAIYRNISVPFTVSGPHIWIGWGSSNLAGLNDGSWGIDNVKVSYNIVPAPATAGLLGLAGLAGLRRRRASLCA